MRHEKPQLNEFEKSELVLRNESFEKLVNNFSLLISGADILEKEIFAGGEFLLVAGGIKPVADIEYSQELFEQLKQSGIIKNNFEEDLIEKLQKLGLKISGLRLYEDSSEYYGYIYNPKLLVLISQKSPALIPFSEDDDIDLWISENRDTGIDIDFIRGSLFGFPESAIESFIAYKKHTQGLHKLKKFGDKKGKDFAEYELKAIRKKEEESRHFIRSYGEVYLAQNPNAPDILEYEKTKKEFFEKLKFNDKFWSLLEETRREANLEEYKSNKDI